MTTLICILDSKIVSLSSVFASVYSDTELRKMLTHLLQKEMISIQCVFANGFTKAHLVKMLI